MSEQDKATEQATIKVKTVSGEKVTKTGKKYFGVLASDGTTWYNVMEPAIGGVVVGANVLIDFNMLGTSRWSRKTVVLPSGNFVGKSEAEHEAVKTSNVHTAPVPTAPWNDLTGLLLASQILRINLATGEEVDKIYSKIKEIYAGISGKL